MIAHPTQPRLPVPVRQEFVPKDYKQATDRGRPADVSGRHSRKERQGQGVLAK
jgi:hypothetical protein